MKAWQFTSVDDPLTLVDVDDPVAGPGEVVIAPRRAGLCHTDTGYMDGTLTKYLGSLPIVLGHEIAGDIVSVGESVREFVVGDRVAVRANSLGPGTGIDGGYATRVKTSEEWLVRIPDSVSYEQAAVATDAGLTAYHAVTARGRVTAGSKVGIIGAGGLGHLGIQFALALGASVFVAEISNAQKEACADYAVSGWGKSILEFSTESLDVIIDYAGFGITTSEAVEAVRFGGRVVLVGIGVPEFTLSSLLVGKEVELFGSLNGTKEDLEQVLTVLAAGEASAHTEAIDFLDIPAGLERLAQGKVQGRLVAEIPQ